MSVLCLHSWSRPSWDKRDSVQHHRTRILSSGKRDCFFAVSSPVQSSQSVRLVLQQLPGLHWSTVHHHQDPPHAHRRLRLLSPEHLPQHPFEKNHQPDCVLWVWRLTDSLTSSLFEPVLSCLSVSLLQSGKWKSSQKWTVYLLFLILLYTSHQF